MSVKPIVFASVVFGTAVKLWILFAVVLFVYDSYKLKEDQKC